MKGSFDQSRGLSVTLLIFAGAWLVAGKPTWFGFAEAAELMAGPPAQKLEKLSDVDLGSAYLRAQQELDRSSLMVHRFLTEARSEIDKRGSTQIADGVYESVVSSACPGDSFESGYARIIQDGAELKIRHESKELEGIVIKDAVLLAIPPKQELLVGNVFGDRVDLIATSSACSMSFARAINLHEAVRSGDAEVVRSVIAAGADVNESDAWGTPLDLAVARGLDEIVGLLIDEGADIEGATLQAVGGRRPLHIAAALATGASTAKLLLSRGAQVNALDKAGRSPLITAVVADNIAVAEALLAAGADIEAIYSGATPLSWAACSSRVSAVKFLLSKGAQINRRAGPDGDTPLHRAVVCCLKVPDMINFLVANGADVNATNNQGLTPIKLTFAKGQKDLLRSLGASE
jgi:ankyrin repeat protein